jgi:DNA-binding transcriptional LysR family regulator
MDCFEAMRTLVAAVGGGGSSAASRTLGVPLPPVIRRVSDLEALPGSPSLGRTSHRLLRTEAGSALDARRSGEVRWVVCARPDYLRRRGEPRMPADLPLRPVAESKQ